VRRVPPCFPSYNKRVSLPYYINFQRLIYQVPNLRRERTLKKEVVYLFFIILAHHTP